MRPAAGSAKVKKRALTGDLGDFGLADILQVLALGRRSGHLLLEGDQTRGRLVIARGEVVHAEADGGDPGEPAFFILMENEAGDFRFLSAEQEEVTASEVTIQRKLDSLLVQATLQYGR